MSRHTSRREFLRTASLAAGASVLPPPRRARREKLRVGVIGVGGRGRHNLKGVAEHDVVALCDVDRRFLEAAAETNPAARPFTDFREMLALDSLDAVVISTPDHTHAPATAMALRRGLDVYCEKPLTHSVYEARRVTELARRYNAVTQMGIQIHALPNYRRVVELVRSGAIGAVRAVHVFVSGGGWSGGDRPNEAARPPEHLDWDLWLGPAPARGYHPTAYHPKAWRGYWDFGGGTTGDMGCHYMDLAFWALGLGHPRSVESKGPAPHPEAAPRGLTTRYEFAARGEHPAVELFWYAGDRAPPSALKERGLSKWRNGVLFIGERGWVIADYHRHAIGPRERFAKLEPPPPTIPDSVGHYREWLDACVTRAPTSCRFEYSGPLTEAVLLANVSHRLGGKRLDWDAENLLARGEPDAAALIRRPYRDGWSL